MFQLTKKNFNSRCVIILIILCLIGAFGYKMWLTPYVPYRVPFLPLENYTPALEGFLNFWTYVIILQVCINLMSHL